MTWNAHRTGTLLLDEPCSVLDARLDAVCVLISRGLTLLEALVELPPKLRGAPTRRESHTPPGRRRTSVLDHRPSLVILVPSRPIPAINPCCAKTNA
jgi:hypothetical protein